MEIVIHGHTILVDEEDMSLITKYVWSVQNRNGYHFCSSHEWIDGVRYTITMHRLIMGCVYGDGKIIDHINHNPLDNRKCNLRFATSAQNNYNKTIHRDKTSTPYKGVFIHESGQIVAAIAKNRKSIHIGYAKSFEEAARMYDMMAIKLFGEFACLNFPHMIYSDNEIECLYKKVMDYRCSKNTSGYRGVSYKTKRHKWEASICVNNVDRYIGMYSTAIEAARARDKVAIELLGEKAILNEYPDDVC